MLTKEEYFKWCKNVGVEPKEDLLKEAKEQ